MRLTSIQVHHWRGLEHIALGPLSPQLNLICGPNRSGKSRLQQAIKFALLESSKGGSSHKAALQSKHSNEPPRVSLGFELGGVQYEVQKQFLKNPFTKLAGGGKTLEGDEAEARLRALLGTRSKREVDIPESGVWSLLLVEQGRAGEVPHTFLNEDSRHRLQGQLSAEVGVATVGKLGQSVMARAEAEYQRHYTATGGERQEIKQARGDVESATAVLQEAEAKLAGVRVLAEDVERLRAEAGSFDTRLQQQRDRHKDAEAKAKQAATAKSGLDLATSEVHRRELEVQSADQAMKKRSTLEGDLKILRAEHAKAERLVESATQKVTHAEQVAEDITAKVAKAEAQREKARATAIDVHAASRKKAIKKNIEDLTKLHEATKKVSDQAATLRKKQSALAKFTDKAVRTLRGLEQKAITANAELKGAAVTLTITAKKDTIISGKSWSKGQTEEQSIVGAKTVTIADLVELKIQPGGTDLGALRDTARDAAQELKDKLKELDVESVAAAETRCSELRDATQALTAVLERLEEMAPDGIDAQKTELAALQGEHDGIAVPPDLPTEAAAEKAQSEADDLCEELRVQRDQVTTDRAEARQQRATADMELKRIAARISEKEGELAHLAAAQDLSSALTQAQAVLAQAVTDRESAQRTYAQSGGDAAALELEQAKKALDGLEASRRNSESELHRQVGRLQAAEAEGLYDAKQKAESELALARGVLGRKLREAAAAKALWDALSARRRSLQEQLTKPIIKRAAEYLEPLFPGCQLAIADNMEISGVLAGDVADEFTDLSGGEKEQLGLVVRLALADVLRGDGTLPLLLDDSMVNTDGDRIQVVQSLLYRAARNLQVIIFTCQGPLFDKLGADYTYNLPARVRPVRAKAA